jgi:hypothetical protein
MGGNAARAWLVANLPGGVLNVAGPRASKQAGVYERARAFLRTLLNHLPRVLNCLTGGVRGLEWPLCGWGDRDHGRAARCLSAPDRSLGRLGR